jgi:hypothetical protein
MEAETLLHFGDLPVILLAQGTDNIKRPAVKWLFLGISYDKMTL